MSQPRRALIVVDVQNEYFDGPLEIQHPDRERALAHVVRALGVAHDRDLPVVVVRHELPEGAPVFAAGSTGWQLHPDIASLERTPETEMRPWPPGEAHDLAVVLQPPRHRRAERESPHRSLLD